MLPAYLRTSVNRSAISRLRPRSEGVAIEVVGLHDVDLLNSLIARLLMTMRATDLN
jgi:hypothetical protein